MAFSAQLAKSLAEAAEGLLRLEARRGARAETDVPQAAGHAGPAFGLDHPDAARPQFEHALRHLGDALQVGGAEDGPADPPQWAPRS